jgi:SET domain-containing protein
MKISEKHTRFHLETRNSQIDRIGLFVLDSIPARRKVIEYAGERIPMREGVRRFWRIERTKGSKRMYLAKLSRSWVIDGAVGGNGSELINHSCDPNLFIKRERGKINYYSKRRIRRGEELTVDYRYTPDSAQVPCCCGSANCRGTINLTR